MTVNQEVIFVMGVEGSGTTMLQNMIDMSKDNVLLGGNVVSKGWQDCASQFNELCTRLWSRDVERERRACLIEEIRHLLSKCPPRIVFKRSYPFIDEVHMPKVVDIAEFSCSLRVIYIKRNCIDNVRSIIRRGFESDFDRASARILQGYGNLLADVEWARKKGISILELNYDLLIEPSTRKYQIDKMVRFLRFEERLRQELYAYIRT